jgi:hypothetical protein
LFRKQKSSSERSRRRLLAKATRSEHYALPLTNTLDFRDQPGKRELYGCLHPGLGEDFLFSSLKTKDDKPSRQLIDLKMFLEEYEFEISRSPMVLIL